MKSISLEISFMVDWISRRKRPAAFILDGPIVYNLRSLILVKFMSMFVSNTTGVKVNTFCCHLPLSPTTHPGIPKPKNFLNVHFLLSKSFFSVPKSWYDCQKNVWEGEEKFLLEKKKISTWHYIVWFPPGFHIVWPTSVLLNRPWLLYHAQMFKPSCHCHDVCQPTIFITKFQMCSLDLRLPSYILVYLQ